MSDTPDERLISHARTVDLGHPENALDRAQKLKEEFDKAKAKEDTQEKQKSRQDGKTDQHAHAPQPQLHLKPPDDENRREVDKQIDKEKLGKLQERAKALKEACEQDFKQQKENELGHEKRLHRSR